MATAADSAGYLLAQLPDDGRVLDVGCGPGTAADRTWVPERGPGELQARGPRIGGRPDVVPGQYVLAKGGVPARGRRH